VGSLRRYLSLTALSWVGDHLFQLAQGLLVLRLTGSGAWVGAVVAIGRVGSIAGLFGGVLADRWSRPLLLAACNLVSGACSLGLGVLAWAGVVEPWHILVLSGAAGLAVEIGQGAALALIGDFAGPEAYRIAVSRYSGTYHACRVIGPLAGGLIISATSLASGFAINAVSFVPVAIFLFLARGIHRPRPSGPVSFTGELAEAIRAMARERAMWAGPVLISCLTALLFLPHVGLLPAVAARLGSGAQALATLAAVGGAGASIAAMLYRPGEGTHARVTVAAVLSALGLVGLGAASGLPAACAAIFVAQAAGIIVWVECSSAIHTRAPSELRSRILAINRALYSFAASIGLMLFGMLADWRGIGQSVLLQGALLLVLVAPSIRMLRRAPERASISG
jgi:MFS family permease